MCATASGLSKQKYVGMEGPLEISMGTEYVQLSL